MPSDRDIPALSTDQMREVDRAMVEDYGILLIQMMENAGRHLAALARERFLDGDPRRRHVLVLVGTGGNGGGGLVAARRLSTWGAEVEIYTTADAAKFTEVPAHQLSILDHMGLTRVMAHQDLVLPASDLIIDAVIGYSLRGAPSGAAAHLIRAANDAAAPVLSLDVPSGIDTASGTVHEPAISAAATMTLALPKRGLGSAAARPKVGELYLADISVPPALYQIPTLGLDVGPLFSRSEIIRVW